MQLRKAAGANVAVAAAGRDYADSDEEVYAAAKAVEAAQGGTVQYDSDDNPMVGHRSRAIET